jgi:hypothetical protein
MKNVTIVLDEETARWLRIEAAERNTSVSRLVGRLLRERMIEDRSYDAAMEEYLGRAPRRLRSGTRRVTREELHDRTRTRIR